MGFTTIVEINNDFFGDIENHPKEFVEFIRDGMNNSTPRTRFQGVKVVTCSHRDWLEPWEKFKKRLKWTNGGAR